MLGHGLVRLPKLNVFSGWMVEFMQKSYLPQPLILGFGYALPFIEIIIGLLLLTGVFQRWALYAGLVLMAILIFGSTTIENWTAIDTQLLHAAYFAGLLVLKELCGNKKAM
ncbi:hypothetical protein GCM10022218_28570 [Sphingobacterium ginsenosidimutans]|uniref:Methylamine utilisation protein MauE domain-containing protein n=2 Tax=Sphingobacterium ginsenosidimutans TaxID=687845 RepID=A0ABP8A5R5_9SPHI